MGFLRADERGDGIAHGGAAVLGDGEEEVVRVVDAELRAVEGDENGVRVVDVDPASGKQDFDEARVRFADREVVPLDGERERAVVGDERQDGVAV